MDTSIYWMASRTVFKEIRFIIVIIYLRADAVSEWSNRFGIGVEKTVDFETV